MASATPPRRRNRANLTADASVVQKFRLAVLRKHGKMYGPLGAETTKALEERIAALKRRDA
jgi:O-acetylhomoserine/O-acetylserine sulfhydrylase-like pyridoxal-dependent enzyme